MECGLLVDLLLVWGKLGCPNFVQVLDYSIFKCGPLFKIGHLVPFLLRKIDNLGTCFLYEKIIKFAMPINSGKIALEIYNFY